MSSSKSPRKNKAFRVTDEQLIRVNNKLKELIKNTPEFETTTDVLMYWIEGDKLISELDEQTIEDLINRIRTEFDCTFLRYMSNAIIRFQCGENVEGKKKRLPLSSDPKETYDLCVDCQKGKEIKRQEEYKKKLETSMIKKILAFREMLISMVSTLGIEVEFYFCTADVKRSQRIVFSGENITMPCLLNEFKLVEIERECLTKINPATKKSPCKYFKEIKREHIIGKKIFEGMEKEYTEVIEQPFLLEQDKAIEVESEEISKTDEEKPSEK